MNRPINRRQFLGSAALAGGYFLVRRRFASTAWADEGSYTVGAVAQPATVSGSVSYEGAVPKPIMKTVNQDLQVAGRAPRVWEGLTLTGKLVRDAVVIINGVQKGKAFSEKPHLAYARGATILERTDVFGLDGAATTLEVENRDPILHSWIPYFRNQQLGNLAHVPGAPPIKIAIKKPGLYELRCAPHQWERAFRMVVPHPYYARTDAKGRFEIAGVPPGKYTATVWAEGFVPVDAPLEVSAGKVAFSPTLTASSLTDGLKKSA